MYVILACYDDDDGAGADEGGGEEEDLVDTEEVGDAVVQGANQAPLLDQGDDVGQGGGDPATPLFVELLKLLRAVRLVLRGCAILDPPPALYLE